MDDLSDAETLVLSRIAAQLERDPAAVLEALLMPPEDPGQVATTLEDGRFIGLSLRTVGLKLRWAQPLGDLTVDLSGLERLESLDVTGLQLTHLDLSSLPALRRLEASENQLRHLDVTANPALQILNLAANEVMVLDLVQQPDLWFLDATGNELSALLVADDHHLKTVRCARNQLMVLQLGTSPHLVELNASRNALVQLEVHAPRLRNLDLRDNQLGELDVSGMPALRKLRVERNRLASLDLTPTPRLRQLDAGRNYLDTLDVGPLVALEHLAVPRNQLVELTLGDSPALAVLDAKNNRLEQLDLSLVPSLQRLNLSANRLTALDLHVATALCELDASHNILANVNLVGCARLARAELHHNPIEVLHLDASPALAHLTVQHGVAVESTAEQRQRLLSLRTRPLPTNAEEMDRFELHTFAATYDEPDREAVLLEIVRDVERCALGTAVMVYWMSSPHYYLRFEERSEVPAYATGGWDLLEVIEDRVRQGVYTHDDVFFDPRNDQQTVDVIGRDWTRNGTDVRGRKPPAFLTLPRGVSC